MTDTTYATATGAPVLPATKPARASSPAPRFWSGMRMDLTGAFLVNLEFSGIQVKAATFKEAPFSGRAWFDEATFDSIAGFGGATFGGLAHFQGAAFRSDVWFDGTTFNSDVWFKGTTFGRLAWFEKATFRTDCWFEGAHLSILTSFEGARVPKGAKGVRALLPLGWRLANRKDGFATLVRDQTT